MHGLLALATVAVVTLNLALLIAVARVNPSVLEGPWSLSTAAVGALWLLRHLARGMGVGVTLFTYYILICDVDSLALLPLLVAYGGVV